MENGNGKFNNIKKIAKNTVGASSKKIGELKEFTNNKIVPTIKDSTEKTKKL